MSLEYFEKYNRYLDLENGYIYRDLGNRFKKCGTKTERGYLRLKINGKNYLYHRLLFEYYYGKTLPKKLQIDHINHQKDDNRIKNLRLVNNQENAQNKESYKGSSSKFKGVCWYKKTNKWEAKIRLNNNLKHLGYYENEIEAAKSYNKYASYLNDTFDCIYSLNEI